jgi:hypothetical protein
VAGRGLDPLFDRWLFRPGKPGGGGGGRAIRLDPRLR